MKKFRLALPILAIVAAVTVVFAAEKPSILTDVNVVAFGASNCNADGVCDQNDGNDCEIVSTGLKFMIRSSSISCQSTIATGKFRE